MGYSLAQLQQLLRQAGWPDTVINTRDGPAPLIPLFASFALAESGGNPNAHNPRGEDSWGLLQINHNAWPQYSIAQLTDPLTNLQLALGIYRVQGTRAWGVGPDWDGTYITRGQYNQSLAIYQAGQPGPAPAIAQAPPVADESGTVVNIQDVSLIPISDQAGSNVNLLLLLAGALVLYVFLD